MFDTPPGRLFPDQFVEHGLAERIEDIQPGGSAPLAQHEGNRSQPSPRRIQRIKLRPLPGRERDLCRSGRRHVGQLPPAFDEGHLRRRKFRLERLRVGQVEKENPPGLRQRPAIAGERGENASPFQVSYLPEFTGAVLSETYPLCDTSFNLQYTDNYCRTIS